MKRIPSRSHTACRHSLMLLAVIITPASVPAGPPDPEPPSETQVAEALSSSFRRAVKIARPSIVTVRTVDRRPESEEAPEAYRTGSATGIIVDASGSVLTSQHAVVDAEVVFIELADGRRFPVTEIRSDARSDLALLHIRDAGTLPEARLGESERVEVGDWVIAAGDSFGLGFSANPGTVSAKQRELAGEEVLLLQTNAPSNPGNSGGPLLNLRGEVVGICEGGYSVQGGFDGVSFAVPVDVAKFVLRELSENGVVRWPYLGVHFETLTPDVAQELECPAGQTGAIVTRVVPDTPAAEAGFRVGDVITVFDGEPILDATALISGIQQSRAGEQVEVVSLRGSMTAKHQVQLIILPLNDENEHREPAEATEDSVENYDARQLGLLVSDLPFDGSFPPGLQGVLINHVESRSAARYLGVHPGSVITHVGSEPVRDLREFKAIMRERSEGEGAVVLIWCDDCGEHFFAIRPELARLPDRVSPRDNRNAIEADSRPAR